MANTSKTTTMTVVALMIALEIILNRFVGITTDTIHVGIDFLPIAAAGMLYGPLWAGMAYAIGDLLGAAIFPYGAVNPMITVTLALAGVTYGLVFYRHDLSGSRIIWRTVIASLIIAIPIKLFLTSLAFSIFYGTPYTAVLVTRIPTCAILLAAQMIIIPMIYKLVVCKLPIYKTAQ